MMGSTLRYSKVPAKLTSLVRKPMLGSNFSNENRCSPLHHPIRTAAMGKAVDIQSVACHCLWDSGVEHG